MGLGLGVHRRLRHAAQRVDEFVLARRRELVLGARARVERRLLTHAREESSRQYARDGDPLVSVTIATWNRASILVERTLPSVLAQTYRNLEIIVVGDCCTDDTADRLAQIDDDRLRFVNLPERGRYPVDPLKRYYVAGSVPMMHARAMATGAWIAHLDDDDVFVPNHVEVLLRRAQQTDAEIVWGQAHYELSPGQWRTEGSPGFRQHDIPHSAVMFRTYLRLFTEDLESWRLRLGADRHRFRRMELAGVRASFAGHVVTLGPLRPGTTKNWAMAEDREAIDGDTLS